MERRFPVTALLDVAAVFDRNLGSVQNYLSMFWVDRCRMVDAVSTHE